MHRRVAVAVLALVAVLAVEVGAAESWKRFVHPQLGFALSYPAEWELIIRQGTLGAAVIGPEIARTGGFRMSVSVASEAVPGNVTLDEFEQISEAKIALVLNGYQRLRTDRTIIGRLPAALRYYTWKRNDGLGIYQMQLYTIAGARGYVLTGTTTTSSPLLEQDAGLLRRIILTFVPKR